MFSLNFVAFFSLLACAASLPRTAPGLGYLFVNGSQKPFCYDLTPNEVCPSSLVNYKILGYNRTTQQIAKIELAGVKSMLQALDFFQASQACRDVVREYSCSNTFAVCKPDSKYGVNLKYNYEKTKAACARIQSICPKTVAEAVVFNCTLIQKDVTGYTYCTKLPEVPGDVCAMSSYTVSIVLYLCYFYILELSRTESLGIDRNSVETVELLYCIPTLLLYIHANICVCKQATQRQ